MDAREAIERGIAAARAGNQRTAYYYFYAATRADPGDEQAWLWRASAAPRPEEALNCLAAVLAINPTNPVAQHGLEQISAALAATRDSEGAAITPSLTTQEGQFQPPEHRLEWQQIFQRDHYDAGRVAHLESPAANGRPALEAAPPDEPATPGAVVPIADRPLLLERVGDSVNGLRRMLVERNALRRQIALIAVIPVALVMLFVFWFATAKFPVAGTPLPPPPGGPTATAILPPTPGGEQPTPAATVPIVNPPGDTPAPTQPPILVPTTAPEGNTPVPPPPPEATPTAPPAPTTAPPPGGERTHTVAAGETLQAIADQAGVSLAALMVYNNLTNPADIHEGQALKIPDPNSPDAHPAQVTHVVRPGENLTSIARLYGVTPEAISAKNGITDPNRIFAGQELIVPLK